MIPANKPECLCLYLVYDGLESGGVVEGEVGENLTINLDACLVDEAHKLGIRKTLHAGSGVDTLDPESTEVALLVLAVAVSIGEAFLPSVFGNGPHVLTAAIITACEFEDFLAFSSRSYVIY